MKTVKYSAYEWLKIGILKNIRQKIHKHPLPHMTWRQKRWLRKNHGKNISILYENIFCSKHFLTNGGLANDILKPVKQREEYPKLTQPVQCMWCLFKAQIVKKLVTCFYINFPQNRFNEQLGLMYLYTENSNLFNERDISMKIG